MLPASSLVLSVFFFPVAAQAGSYTLTYSGGNVTPADVGTTNPFSGGRTYIAYGAAGVNNGRYDGSHTVKIDDTTAITATFTWTHGKNADGTPQTDANDPPPTTAIVDQYSDAAWSMPDGETGASGSVSTGLPNPTTSTTATGVTVSSTSYSVQASAGASFSITCTPTASFTGGYGMVSVEYSAGAYPVTVGIGGTTLVNGTPEVLTGQPCTASLVISPDIYMGAFTGSSSNFSWVIESQEGGSLTGGYVAQQALGMLIYPVLTNSTMTFYDSIADTVTVNLASVTITFPDNTTGTANATTTVTVVKPTLLKPLFSIVESDNFSQQANNTSTQYGAIETFTNLQIIMPTGFTGGTGGIVQKVQSTSRTDMRGTGVNYTEQQEQFGGAWIAIPTPCLDTDFLYPFASTWATTAAGSQPTASGTGSGGDTPGVLCAPPLISGDTGSASWDASSGNDQFMDWIMFNPNPQSSSDIWIPLNTFTWGWSNQASLNSTTNTWSASNFQGTSGAQSLTTSGEWPTWTTWVPYSGTGELAMRP